MNRSIYYFVIILLMMSLLTLACSPQVVEVEVTRMVELESVAEVSSLIEETDYAAGSVGDETEGDVSSENYTGGEQAAPPAQERLIIRNGNLRIQVADTQEAVTAIGGLTDNLSGWVVRSNVSQILDGAQGEMTLRVPAESFNFAMEEIKRLATEVKFESVSGEDVTDEFVDLSSRMKNLEATADRVRAFLDEAETVEEALEVSNQLSRLEGDIEVIKGRLKFLSESAAYSSITVSIVPDAINQPIELVGWQPVGVAKDAIEALLGTLQSIGTAAIWLGIYVVPVALITLVPLYGLMRWWRKRASVPAVTS